MKTQRRSLVTYSVGFQRPLARRLAPQARYNTLKAFQHLALSEEYTSLHSPVRARRPFACDPCDDRPNTKTVDLFEGKDIGLVVRCIYSLGSAVQLTCPEFDGPSLGAKLHQVSKRPGPRDMRTRGEGRTRLVLPLRKTRHQRLQYTPSDCAAPLYRVFTSVLPKTSS